MDPGGSVLRSIASVCVLGCVLYAAPAGAQQSFGTGSIIIPMDIDYQDNGMLRSYGLLYQLLKSNIPVNWCIAKSKSTLYLDKTPFPTSPAAAAAVDFTATVKDLATNATIGSHGYRGGPFVIDSAYAAAAAPIINAWNTKNCATGCMTGNICRNLVVKSSATMTKTTAVCEPIVAAHSATAPFTAEVSRTLVNAPNIGINADGNEGIAFVYLNTARVPDSLGNGWSDFSPDVMTPEDIAGPTTTKHCDGKLFGANCVPQYCQIMSMHWTVDRTASTDETMSEMSHFLQFPTHRSEEHTS